MSRWCIHTHTYNNNNNNCLTVVIYLICVKKNKIYPCLLSTNIQIYWRFEYLIFFGVCVCVPLSRVWFQFDRIGTLLSSSSLYCSTIWPCRLQIIQIDIQFAFIIWKSCFFSSLLSCKKWLWWWKWKVNKSILLIIDR